MELGREAAYDGDAMIGPLNPSTRMVRRRLVRIWATRCISIVSWKYLTSIKVSSLDLGNVLTRPPRRDLSVLRT